MLLRAARISPITARLVINQIRTRKEWRKKKNAGEQQGFKGWSAAIKSISGVVIVVGCLLTPPALFWDEPYRVWRLQHPDLPNPPTPLPDIANASSVEDTLKQWMEWPVFLLVDGMPGTGKSTAVARVARERGAGVILHRVFSGREGLQRFKKNLHERFTAPLSRWDDDHQPPLCSQLRELARVCRKWCGKDLIVIIDNVNLLSEGDIAALLYIGEEAKAEERSFSLWMVVGNEETGFKGREICERSRERTGFRPLEVLEVPGMSEEELRKMARELLGCSAELAEMIVYYSGRSLRTLLDLVERINGLSADEVLKQLPGHKHELPKSFNAADEELWRKLLGEEGEQGLEIDDRSVEKLVNKGCLEVSRGRVRARSGSCRDAYRVFFAMVEVKWEENKVALALAAGGSSGGEEAAPPVVEAENLLRTRKEALVDAWSREWGKRELFRQALIMYKLGARAPDAPGAPDQ